MQTRHSFDERLLQWIHQHRTAPLDSVTRAMMDIGTSLTFIVGCAIVGLVLVIVFRAWRPGAAVVLASGLAGEVSGLLKEHIQRLRPPLDLSLVQIDGYAMPSSHAAVTSAVAVALVISVPWTSTRQRSWAAAVLGLAVVVVAASMVYLGAHWATDVFAGWALGIAVGAGVGAALRPRTGQSPTSPA
ncbi:MAG: hypothetical protein JWQ70_1903 [Aeromicrobium sp.]|jgi:membrane-associated phospholipid phosphatase|nr:hypothetical protein [Aeromicrobium sp.]